MKFARRQNRCSDPAFGGTGKSGDLIAGSSVKLLVGGVLTMS